MKQLLLSLSMLAAIATQAQKLEVGVNAGMGFNSKPSFTSESNYAVYSQPQKHSLWSDVGSVKLLMNYGKWQFGAELGYRQLSYQRTAYGFVILPEAKMPFQTIYISKAAYTAKAFANRKVTTGKFESYAGVSAGYVLATKNEDALALADQYYDHVNGNGFTAGAQLGTTYFLTKHLGFNAEVGADYMIITLGGATYNLFAFPATVGVRVKL
jgi:hypothetical protein